MSTVWDLSADVRLLNDKYVLTFASLFPGIHVRPHCADLIARIIGNTGHVYRFNADDWSRMWTVDSFDLVPYMILFAIIADEGMASVAVGLWEASAGSVVFAMSRKSEPKGREKKLDAIEAAIGRFCADCLRMSLPAYADFFRKFDPSF